MPGDENKSYTRALIIDIISIVILIIIWILFNFNFFLSENPVNRRGWFRDDISISLPYTGHGTIPTVPLTLFAFGMPVFALILTWIFVDKLCCCGGNPWRYNDVENTNDYELFTSIAPLDQPIDLRNSTIENDDSLDGLIGGCIGTNTSSTFPRHVTASQTRRNYIKQITTDPHYWAHYYDQNTKAASRKVRFALYQLMILVFVLIICIIITTSLKYTVGRLRPDFLDRCKPDYSHPDLVIGDNGWIDSKYEFICAGSSSMVSAGRESFPSGHSSSSLTAATFVAILLYKRCWNRGQRAMGFIVIPFLITAAVTGGFLIATSRYHDNRHHMFDIFSGSLLGILCGSLSLLFPNVFTPTWECDGTLNQPQIAIDEENEALNENPQPSSPTMITRNLEMTAVNE